MSGVANEGLRRRRGGGEGEGKKSLGSVLEDLTRELNDGGTEHVNNNNDRDDSESSSCVSDLSEACRQFDRAASAMGGGEGGEEEPKSSPRIGGGGDDADAGYRDSIRTLAPCRPQQQRPEGYDESMRTLNPGDLPHHGAFGGRPSSAGSRGSSEGGARRPLRRGTQHQMQMAPLDEAPAATGDSSMPGAGSTSLSEGAADNNTKVGGAAAAPQDAAASSSENPASAARPLPAQPKAKDRTRAIIPTDMVSVERLNVAFRRASLLAVGAWATLGVLCFTLTPPDSWRAPSSGSPGRLAEGAACLVMATSVATKLMYMILGGTDGTAAARGASILGGLGGGDGEGENAKKAQAGGDRIEGAAFAGFVVQSIGAFTNGALALLPTPVKLDAVTGVEVALFRWCEWAPCAAIMAFMTMAMDASDEPGCPGTFGVRGLKGAVLFGLSQGLSTLCGMVFPLLEGRRAIWWTTMAIAVGLHSTLHPSLLKKLRRAKRLRTHIDEAVTGKDGTLRRPRSADELERTERTRLASQLMLLVTCAWSVLIGQWFLAWYFGIGADTRAIVECLVEVLSKHYYLSFLLDANAKVFCARRRTEWRLEEIKDHMLAMASQGNEGGGTVGQAGASLAGSIRGRRFSQDDDYDYYDDYEISSDDDSSFTSSVVPTSESVASRYLRGEGANPNTDMGTATADLANAAAHSLAFKIRSANDLAGAEQQQQQQGRRPHDGSVEGSVGSLQNHRRTSDPYGGAMLSSQDDASVGSWSQRSRGPPRRRPRRRQSMGGRMNYMADVDRICEKGPEMSTSSPPRSSSAEFGTRFQREVAEANGSSTAGSPPPRSSPEFPGSGHLCGGLGSRKASYESLVDLVVDEEFEAPMDTGGRSKSRSRQQRRRGSRDSVDSNASDIADDPAFAREVKQSLLARRDSGDDLASVESNDDMEGEMGLGDIAAARRIMPRGAGSVHGSMSSIGKRVSDTLRQPPPQVQEQEAPPPQQQRAGSDDVLDALQGLLLDMQSPTPQGGRIRRESDSISAGVEDGSYGDYGRGGGGRSRRRSMFPREPGPGSSASSAAPPIPSMVGGGGAQSAPVAPSVKVKPETLDDVTVLFSDVVGFTSMCSKMEVEEVGSLIERLFAEFDRLAERHGVTKIDVIGDAYFGLCGIPDREGHAARAAMFSLDAIRASNSMPACIGKPELGNISVRFGLASGSVVATMVGSGNHLKYTLFGDVVNTASRMESTSIPNRTQCTKVTADLIREQGPAINVEYRGETEVKGKGKLETFFINPPKDGFDNVEGLMI